MKRSRKELKTELRKLKRILSFFDFLFSERWEEGCLVRVLTGKLLDSILHCLTKLETFHDIISYATVAYIHTKKPLLPCIRTAEKKTEFELIEERVLVEFDCFYPQERPEVIKERLQTTGGFCFPESQSQSFDAGTLNDVSQDIDSQSDFRHQQSSALGHDVDTSTTPKLPVSLSSRARSKPAASMPNIFGTRLSVPSAPLRGTRTKIDSMPNIYAIRQPRPPVPSVPSGILQTSKRSVTELPPVKHAVPSTPSDAIHAKKSSITELPPIRNAVSSVASVPSDAGHSSKSSITELPPTRNTVSSVASVSSDAIRASKSSITELPPIRNAVSSVASVPSDAGHSSKSSITELPPTRNTVSSVASVSSDAIHASKSSITELPPIRNVVSSVASVPSDADHESKSSVPELTPIQNAGPSVHSASSVAVADDSWSKSSIQKLPPNTDAASSLQATSSSVSATQRARSTEVIQEGSGQRFSQSEANEIVLSSRLKAELPTAQDFTAKMTEEDSLDGSVERVSSGNQKGSHGSGTTAKSSSNLKLPEVKCNIRGLTLPPPHETCLKPYHMIREPFLQRRLRQNSAFPKIALPELHLTISSEFTADEAPYLTDEQFPGMKLEDSTELVASTTCLFGIPTPSVDERDARSSISKNPASKFLRELALEKRDSHPLIQTVSRLEYTGSDSTSTPDSFEAGVEERIRCFCPDHTREKTFLLDLDRMSKELLVNPSRPKEMKDDAHKRLKAAVIDKYSSRQHTRLEESKQRGPVADKQRKYPLRTRVLSMPHGSPVDLADVKRASSLSYKQAPMPDPPFNFLKKWDKTPTFYEFYMYLQTQKTETTASEVIKQTDSKTSQLRLTGTQSRLCTETPLSSTEDDRSARRTSGKGVAKKETPKTNASHTNSFSSSELNLGGRTSKADNSKFKTGKNKHVSVLQQPSSSFPKPNRNKPTSISKREALDKLHAHTRIQIAQFHSVQKPAIKPSLSGRPGEKEDKLLLAALGITLSGTHLLTEEQEVLFEEEKLILSSIDPWHISVRFAYLAGGVCDSIGVRNDLLKRRERILSLLKEANQIVKENETRVRNSMKTAHAMVLGHEPKEEKSIMGKDVSREGEQIIKKGEVKEISIKKEKKKSGSVVKEKQTNKGDHEDERKTTRIYDEMLESDDIREDETHGKKYKSRKSSSKDVEKSHGASELQYKKSASEMSTSGEKVIEKHRTSIKSDSSEKSEKGERRSGKESEKGMDNRLPKRPVKSKGYTYIDDADVPDDLTPKQLFRLLRVGQAFDPRKLHSAYSFEKLFSHRQAEIPDYSKLLAMFNKPYRQKKKKIPKAQKRKTTTIKRVKQVEVEATPEPDVPPFVLGKMRDFKFLKHKNHISQPIKIEDPTGEEMSTDEFCQNMILAMQVFVVRKERATTTFGTCQYKSKLSITFTKRRPGDEWVGVPPLPDGHRHIVAAVCQTLKAEV